MVRRGLNHTVIHGDRAASSGVGVMTAFYDSRQQRAASRFIAALCDFENKIRLIAGDRAGEQALAFDPADLGHRALRTPVLVADPEHDRVDESEGVVEHHALDLAVGAAAPMAAGEEGPADLDFADLGLVAVIAARSDQPAGGTANERKAHV